MSLKKITLVLLILFVSREANAIEAFRGLSQDVENAEKSVVRFVKSLFFYGFPVLASITFTVLRHVNKNIWYSFGIYVPGLIFLFVLPVRSAWLSYQDDVPEPSVFSTALILMAIFLVVNVIADVKFVREQRAEQLEA